jgi:hypothetical protein
MARGSGGGDGILIKYYEFAESRWEAGLRRSAERIDAKLVFEPRGEDRETQGIKPGFEQGQIVAEWRDSSFLLARNSFNLGANR